MSSEPDRSSTVAGIESRGELRTETPEHADHVGTASVPDRPGPAAAETAPEAAEGARASRLAGDLALGQAGLPADGSAAKGDAVPARCSCGAAWSADDPRRCMSGHQRPGVTGIKLEDGLSAEHLPEPEAPAGGDWAAHARHLRRRHLTRFSQSLDRRTLGLKDLPRLEKFTELADRVEQAELAARARPGDREPGTCGWGHRLCPYYTMPDLEADLLLRAAAARLAPHLVDARAADAIADALTKDADVREAVLRRLADGGLIDHERQRRARKVQVDALLAGAAAGDEDDDDADLPILYDDEEDEP